MTTTSTKTRRARAGAVAMALAIVAAGAAIAASAAPAGALPACPVVNATTFAVTPAPAAGVDWSGCDLSHARLVAADLTGAHLAATNFASADLSGATVTGADLTGAHLATAVLTHVASGGIVGVPADLPAGWSLVTGTLVPPRPTFAQAQQDSVYRLYRAYFLREPDAGGLAYWVARYQGGRSLISISDAFVRSSEFRRRYGALSDTAFVQLIYANLFDRAPDVGGLSYWVDALGHGRSRGEVMLNFSESAEFRRITGTA